MARPAPTPSTPDDEFDGNETDFRAEKRAAPLRQDKRPQPANDTGSPAPTTAQLKEDIDRGAAGTKVAAPDPAAAPLGTDDEAAGTPPSAPAVLTAHREEIGKAPATAKGGGLDVGGIIYLGALALFAAAISAAVVLVFF
jgi:hypothetical protein